MYVVQIASQCAPVTKAGGLGDIVYRLSRELENRGHWSKLSYPSTTVCAMTRFGDCTMPTLTSGFPGMTVQFTVLSTAVGYTGGCVSSSNLTPRIISSTRAAITVVTTTTCDLPSSAKLL